MADTMKNITMTVVNATGGYDTLYPKTVAGQVYINSEKTKTLADHVADTDLHLSASERTALTKTNQAEGYLTLDAQGFVPTSKLNPASLAVKLEFANIAEVFERFNTSHLIQRVANSNRNGIVYITLVIVVIFATVILGDIYFDL